MKGNQNQIDPTWAQYQSKYSYTESNIRTRTCKYLFACESIKKQVLFDMHVAMK